MLDFDAVREGTKSFEELVQGLTRDDLKDLTNEMVDTILDLIADCVDEDVVFEPSDPDAHDPYAADPEDVSLAWNLGHVIVHVTASSEESAALAAELARGVENHGRSRSEIPWQRMKTMASCRRRLEESRRMRIASLGMWPEEPYLDNVYRPWEEAPEINAVGRFILGLMHDDSHLGQIADIVRQSKASGA
ncbi:MAG: DinB family protein [Anaerolineales bacterium]|nr:DinB family protein [Anaerolineales bacterium]